MTKVEIIKRYKELVNVEPCFEGIIANVRCYFDPAKVLKIDSYDVTGYEIHGNFAKSSDLRLIVRLNKVSDEAEAEDEQMLPFALVSMRVLEYVLGNIEKKP